MPTYDQSGEIPEEREDPTPNQAEDPRSTGEDYPDEDNDIEISPAVESDERDVQRFPWDDQETAIGGEPELPEAGGAGDTGPSQSGDDTAPADDDTGNARLDWKTVGLAMKEARGNRVIAAAALGISTTKLGQRLASHPILRSLYIKVDESNVPSDDILLRRQKDSPLGADMTPQQLAESIAAQDKQIQMQGFKALGISDKTILKLKTLDGLAKTMGKFLSVSVETSYQMFSIQQIHLFEEAESVREMLHQKEVPEEKRLYYYRLYLDMVREINRGHSLQFSAAAALVNMMNAAKGRIPPSDKPKEKRVKPGFSNNPPTPGE